VPAFHVGRPLAVRRRASVVCAALAAGAIAAPGASAHVGVRSSAVDAGPYRLVILARPVTAGTRVALAFLATITDASSGAPVASAAVSVAVANRSGSPRGTYRLSGFRGVYSLFIPIPSADTWRSLRFRIGVEGPLGAASAQYVPPGLLDEWVLDPWLLALSAAGSALFLQGFLRLRRRGRTDHASLRRLVLFGLGLCLMLGPLVSPLDPVGDQYLLSAHMLQHVLIGDAGPALLLLSLRGPLLFFMLPRGLLRRLAHRSWLRRSVAWILRPRVALVGWALAYGGWHVPAAYDFAASHQLAHDFEHASFVLAGLLVWSLLIDPARRGQLSRGRRLAVAAGVFAMGTVISDILIFSLHPLYPFYANQVERVFSLSPLRDQQLAGLVMVAEQTLTLGSFALILLLPVLRGRRGGRELVAGFGRLA